MAYFMAVFRSIFLLHTVASYTVCFIHLKCSVWYSTKLKNSAALLSQGLTMANVYFSDWCTVISEVVILHF